jgi:hypothetical protein
MKRIVFIGALAIGLLTISSCKKDWSCSCYNSTLNVTTSTPINNETLLNARSKCKDMQSSSGIGSVTCSLQ